MAEKIKNFFKKKKADAKFKLAGPGHKLTEEANKPTKTSGSSKAVIPQRTAPPEEARLAAEAALLRINGAARESKFNTSLSAIQAQVKRELEAERKAQLENKSSASSIQTASSVSEVSLEASPHLTVEGVYFRCPMISEEVLTKEEWKINIKKFLYEQLAEEPGLTACLILQSCNHSREKVEACVETLCKYLENIVAHPDEEKYHKIRMSNRVFSEKVQPLEGSMELLGAAGFLETSLPAGDGAQPEPFMLFSASNVDSLESLTMLVDALRSATPIPLLLDRGLQVLLPSQAAVGVNLPPAFYSMSAEEVQREQRLRAEGAERAQQLRTKAMRERDEAREMRKYKYALVRVRFPDGILLQGTFSIYDKLSEVFSFVQDNLEHAGLPFVLSSAPNIRVDSDQASDTNPESMGEQTLVQLRLVPAVVMTFAWHSSVAEQVASSPQKDVYLKPEVMMLVQHV